MVSAFKVYVEGGGDHEALNRKCREGFRKFLENAGFKGRMPRVVACGGRRAAYEDFKIACESGANCFLLIDSEDLVSSISISPWEYLKNRKGDEFTKPACATDDHCHFMVVCMESWFLADKTALGNFFGQGFNGNALPKNVLIEEIPKKDVYDGLGKATSHSKTKTSYSKGAHSFDILARIDPQKVIASSPWAKRFVECLEKTMPENRI
ncbi:MAG: DUF4276 family protein [bacterium]|nr:DUF4276 family protein [bacterium]